MSIEDLTAEGVSYADASNHEMARSVITRAGAISKMAATIDLDLATYLEPDTDAWGWADSSPSDLVAAFLAVKQAAEDLRLVVRYAEQIAADALGADTVHIDGRAFKAKSTPTRKFPPEKKSELRDVMTRTVATKVAVDPVTGEFDKDAGRLAREVIDQVDRFQTIDPAKFKTTHLKAEGIDVREFSETEWSKKVAEVPL